MASDRFGLGWRGELAAGILSHLDRAREALFQGRARREAERAA